MTAPLARTREGWDRFWFVPQSTAPVELFRIVFGIVATAWMFSLIPILEPFFGPDGAIPVPELTPGAWTLLILVHGTPLIWALWLAGVLGAVALTVGLQTRLAALVVFVVMVSVNRWAPIALNAGDGLLRILSLYAAPHARRVGGLRGSVARAIARACGPSRDRAPWALRLAQIQLSVIYLTTVWEKAGGAAAGGTVRRRRSRCASETSLECRCPPSSPTRSC